MKSLITTAIAFVLALNSAQGSLVTNLDFDDAIWTVSPYQTDLGIVNDSAISAGSATASKASGPTGASGLQITLNTPISVAGYQDLELRFSHAPAGGLEWDSPIGLTTNQDGFRLSSTQGISFITDDAVQPEATVLDTGNSWAPSNTPSAQGDLTFDSSVNNGAISDLEILLAVNAATESLTLSGFEIHGTLIAAVVPEPTTTLLLPGFISALVCISRRRRKIGVPVVESSC